MKRFLLGLAIVAMSVSPAFCDEHEFDLDEELERIEFEQMRSGLEFDQKVRELEIQKRLLELERLRREMDRPDPHQQKKKDGEFLFLIFGIVHILMAIWVYKDVRKRNNGNGVWIAITLLVGFFGASVYALIRMGDCSPKPEE
ncbi:MAG: hypothetical protein DRP64_07790 [Verrucomicrobia bacterium]|nr:MAG: hypothetical protein DRP64_07790 [Verrucomicrobiota bacterium]